MRALIVTNMYPSPSHPGVGSFVRDQVRALRALGEAEIELFSFDPGGPARYLGATRALRRRYRGERFDIVHAHFGLTVWPALAVPADRHVLTMHGTDLTNRRSRAVTLAGLRFVDLAAAVSAPLAAEVPRWATRHEVAVLPCGVDTERFHPIGRREARVALGLELDRPYLLFPADPARSEKRYERAAAVAEGTRLLTLGQVDPDQVPLWVNAANAVIVPSERESFGLAVLEALACDVPVLATPVGVAAQAIGDTEGALCAPFEATRWRQALAPHLADADPRIAGRARAEAFSAREMASRVLAAWRRLLGPGSG